MSGFALLRKMGRVIASIVLVTFTSLVTLPTQAALQQPAAPQPQKPGKSEQFGETLKAMKEAAHNADQKAKQGKDYDSEIKALLAQKAQLEALEGDIRDGFEATGEYLKDKKLPTVILDRQNAAVKEFETKHAALKAQLDVLERSDKAGDKTKRKQATADLADFLDKNQKVPTHTPVDPNKLPWGTPKPIERKPYKTAAQFKLSRLFSEPVKVAQAGSLSGIGLPNTTLPAIPTAEDLAATEDVQITQPIKDLATSLNNNPVKIYNWVRNNIAFLPTYGSIQGSDMTLQVRRGNAFDTASLLIALYRAAGIPSRYVYGTVQIPADQVMNWVGGVTKPEAALQLLGQGGIPSGGITSGGAIKWIELEHVWVEAYVDYSPSRGAVNKKPNTWVPVDASFKQYIFTQGIAVNSAISFNAQNFLAQMKQGATINTQEGSVQNVNQQNVQAVLANYQQQFQAYLATQKPSATTKDIIGTQVIAQRDNSVFSGSLPYITEAVGSKFNLVPDNLRHKFAYKFYANAQDRALDSPTFTLTQSLPSLAGKRLTLSFLPATQADTDLINSYLPKPHTDGTPIQPNEFPSSLPGYLIKLVAKLRVDGQVVATGGNFMMGEELQSVMGLYDPKISGWNYTSDVKLNAGDYKAIGINLAGVSATQLKETQQKLGATAQQSPANLQSDDVVGGMLNGVILAYFGLLDGTDEVGQKAFQTISYRLPSFGTYSADAQVNYWYGLPQSVKFPGLTMDINKSANIVAAKDNDDQKRINYVKTLGFQASALEHGVPEMAFSSPANPISGVSAVKLLTLANQQGMKIYTITKNNINTVLPLLSVSTAVQSDVSNAVAAGREVTVPQGNLQVGAWIGTGYVISDPETGSGAYMISGGTRGGFMQFFITFVSVIASTTSLALLLIGFEVTRAIIDPTLKLVGIIIDVKEIFDKCNGYSWAIVLAIYAGVSLLLGAVASGGASLGPLAVLLFSVLADRYIEMIKDGAIRQFCQNVVASLLRLFRRSVAIG